MADKTPEQILQEIAALTTRMDIQDKTIEKLQKSNESLVKENKELKAVLNKAAEPAKEAKPLVIPSETFKVDGRTFKFIVPKMIYNGQELTAIDALNDEAVLADLVKRKAGCIQEVH